MTISAIVIVTALISIGAFNAKDLMNKLVLNPYMVAHRKEYWRLITHGLIHKDFLHLLFNMYVLWGFGQTLGHVFSKPEMFEAQFGPNTWWGSLLGNNAFLMLYVGSIVFAALPSMVKHKNNPGYSSLGASGAVSAVVMAYIIIFPTQKLSLLFIPVPMPAFVMGILFFAYETYMNRRGGTGIAHDAHLFGALFGLIFLLIVMPGVYPRFVEQVLASFR
ncbi:MAG: hypothetical protein RL226_1243 [Bacteroidota bacterium]|jgi:membrane associated rhomboid family serine protease